MANEAEWYYAVNDQRNGPVTVAELRQLAQMGKIGPESMVWKDGMEEWKPASRIRGLLPPAPTTAGAATARAGTGTNTTSGTDATQAAAQVVADGVATAGRVLDQVGRFGDQMHRFSSSMFQSEGGRDDDHPAIFVRGKYFGGCIQKGLPASTLRSFGSTLLAVLFSWAYLGLILYLMGAAWQFLPFHRTEFLSVRLRRRVRPSVIVPVIITWAVQMFAVYLLCLLGMAVAAGLAKTADSSGILALAGMAVGAITLLWYGICNFIALKALQNLESDGLFDFQAILEYGYPRKVALIRGTSGGSMEQQLEGVLTLCEQLGTVEFGRWDQVTTHGREGMLGGIWNRVQNLV
ncbi:MAG: DUF4339 domain-containing protein [Bacteroidales bacterium]|nr:DUF4339 domain-containing protein [Bacteroidales bacterium]